MIILCVSWARPRSIICGDYTLIPRTEKPNCRGLDKVTVIPSCVLVYDKFQVLADTWSLFWRLYCNTLGGEANVQKCGWNTPYPSVLVYHKFQVLAESRSLSGDWIDTKITNINVSVDGTRTAKGTVGVKIVFLCRIFRDTFSYHKWQRDSWFPLRFEAALR